MTITVTNPSDVTDVWQSDSHHSTLTLGSKNRKVENKSKEKEKKIKFTAFSSNNGGVDSIESDGDGESSRDIGNDNW